MLKWKRIQTVGCLVLLVSVSAYSAIAPNVNVKKEGLKAVEKTLRCDPVIVAVIDTGIDASHPGLKDGLWRGKNGEYGWDFVKDKANPKDDNGHGTHVAGIIRSVVKEEFLPSEIGTKDVLCPIEIMAVRYYSASLSSQENIKNTAKAIDYAIQNGARIINYSSGGHDFSSEEFEAIEKAKKAGVLFVSAAGNESENVDLPDNRYFPAAYPLDNILSVAAVDRNHSLIPASSWGKTKVHIAALGNAVVSSLPGSRMGTLTGTSQATAFVSGLTARMLSRHPNLKPEQVIELVVAGADHYPTLNGKNRASGTINIDKTLSLVEKTRDLATVQETELTFNLVRALSDLSQIL